MKYTVAVGDSLSSRSIEVEAASFEAAIEQAIPAGSDAKCHGVWDEEGTEVYTPEPESNP